MDKNF